MTLFSWFFGLILRRSYLFFSNFYSILISVLVVFMMFLLDFKEFLGGVSGFLSCL
jgi:predicted RND superfamily exporter protein